jgi:hypothetical protein
MQDPEAVLVLADKADETINQLNEPSIYATRACLQKIAAGDWVFGECPTPMLNPTQSAAQ